MRFGTGTIQVPDGVMVRDLQGELVLLNLNTESYFGLDEVGTRMWAALTESASMQAAFETLQNEYEVEGEQLRSDLSTFIERLSEAGLLRVIENP
jgi:hypothetical protein